MNYTPMTYQRARGLIYALNEFEFNDSLTRDCLLWKEVKQNEAISASRYIIQI